VRRAKSCFERRTPRRSAAWTISGDPPGFPSRRRPLAMAHGEGGTAGGSGRPLLDAFLARSGRARRDPGAVGGGRPALKIGSFCLVGFPWAGRHRRRLACGGREVGRRVALKVLQHALRDDATARRRSPPKLAPRRLKPFRSRARFYETGESERGPFIAMERSEASGLDLVLRARPDRGSLPISTRCCSLRGRCRKSGRRSASRVSRVGRLPLE